MFKHEITSTVTGTVTRLPARMLHTLEIQIRRLDTGRLMELEVRGKWCGVTIDEQVRISYLSQRHGDLPLIKEIYSITYQRKIFPRSLFGW